MVGQVLAVARDERHRFSKLARAEITLIAGLGVEGDAHAGATVQHRSRVAIDPSQPNLRQVHLLHAELFDELRTAGFEVGPADLGENITTKGLDLLALPTGALLRIGKEAVIEVTGLRNPCHQIDRFQSGLLSAVLVRGPGGKMARKAGIMGTVTRGGPVRVNDPIEVILPPLPHVALARV